MSHSVVAFRKRLIETVLWCHLHAKASDPRNSLRTPALRPGNGRGGDYRGQLLLADPTQSDWSAISREESGGFIDDGDVPPWDTWVHYGHQEPMAPDPDAVRKTREIYRAHWNQNWDPLPRVNYLLCWVPDAFVENVNRGIAVNPVECFFWASEYRARHYNTALLRLLDAQGLLG